MEIIDVEFVAEEANTGSKGVALTVLLSFVSCVSVALRHYVASQHRVGRGCHRQPMADLCESSRGRRPSAGGCSAIFQGGMALVDCHQRLSLIFGYANFA